MLMMLPPRPCSIISRATYLVHRNAPVRITAICRDHSSRGMSSTPLVLKMTAPLTKMSTPPNTSLARATAAGIVGLNTNKNFFAPPPPHALGDPTADVGASPRDEGHFSGQFHGFA